MFDESEIKYIVLGVVFYHPETDEIGMYQLVSHNWEKNDGDVYDLTRALRQGIDEILKRDKDGWIHIGEL